MVGGAIFLIVFHILLIVIPLFKTVKDMVSFVKGSVKKRKPSSPENILDLVGGNAEIRGISRKYTYPELLFNGISPVLGSAFIFIFSNSIKPFDLSHTPTLLAFSAIPFIAYWLSRRRGDQLTIKALSIIESGLVSGVILYLAYTMHYCSEMGFTGIAILPIFGFTLVAPLPATFYMIRELIYVKNKINHKKEHELHLPSVLKPPFKMSERTKGHLIFALGFAALWLGLVFIGGQDWDSIIKAFTGGREFLFSTK